MLSDEERKRLEKRRDKVIAEARHYEADLAALRKALEKKDRIWIDEKARTKLLCRLGKLVCYGGGARSRTGEMVLTPEAIVGLILMGVNDPSGEYVREATFRGAKILEHMKPKIRDKVDRDAGPKGFPYWEY